MQLRRRFGGLRGRGLHVGGVIHDPAVQRLKSDSPATSSTFDIASRARLAEVLLPADSVDLRLSARASRREPRRSRSRAEIQRSPRNWASQQPNTTEVEQQAQPELAQLSAPCTLSCSCWHCCCRLRRRRASCSRSAVATDWWWTSPRRRKFRRGDVGSAGCRRARQRVWPAKFTLLAEASPTPLCFAVYAAPGCRRTSSSRAGAARRRRARWAVRDRNAAGERRRGHATNLIAGLRGTLPLVVRGVPLLWAKDASDVAACTRRGASRRATTSTRTCGR